MTHIVNRDMFVRNLKFWDYLDNFNKYSKEHGWGTDIFTMVMWNLETNDIGSSDRESCIDGEYPVEILILADFTVDNRVACVKLWHEGMKRPTHAIRNIPDLFDRYVRERTKANNYWFKTQGAK